MLNRGLGFLASLPLLIALSAAGCTSAEGPTPLPGRTPGGTVEAENTPEPTWQPARLRVTNRGAVAIEDLTVYFPEDEVPFGNVPAGSSTEYQAVPNGVYGYAAYRFTVNGEVVLQPVIDWVGEVPLDGTSFTYVIDFSPNRNRWEMVKLLEVTHDE